ncbi:hypothetical protein F4861DRAFT_339407 [Xylaria intraflava]|nr:hypothetical protein F4861DRAFT_339407 [Xylaria intraflava]
MLVTRTAQLLGQSPFFASQLLTSKTLRSIAIGLSLPLAGRISFSFSVRILAQSEARELPPGVLVEPENPIGHSTLALPSILPVLPVDLQHMPIVTGVASHCVPSGRYHIQRVQLIAYRHLSPGTCYVSVPLASAHYTYTDVPYGIRRWLRPPSTSSVNARKYLLLPSCSAGRKPETIRQYDGKSLCLKRREPIIHGFETCVCPRLHFITSYNLILYVQAVTVI